MSNQASASSTSEQEDMFILGGKASRDVAAWSVTIHLLKSLLVEGGPSKDSVKQLMDELKGQEDLLVLLQLPFSWKAGLCGDFELDKVEGSGSAVVQSLGAEVIRKLLVHHGSTNVLAIVQELRGQADTCSKTHVRFAISIQAVLLWSRAEVKFQHKPLSTCWKYWETDTNNSKHGLGTALLTMLSRVEKLTWMAVQDHGNTKEESMRLYLEGRPRSASKRQRTQSSGVDRRALVSDIEPRPFHSDELLFDGHFSLYDQDGASTSGGRSGQSHSESERGANMDGTDYHDDETKDDEFDNGDPGQHVLVSIHDDFQPKECP